MLHCVETADRNGQACGFLAAEQHTPTVASMAVRIFNTSTNAKRYRMEPNEVSKVLDDFDRRGIDVLGIYHSHLDSEAYLTDDDLSMVDDTTVAQVVVSLSDQKTYSARAFAIHMPGIGVMEPRQIPINVVETSDEADVNRPLAPWALTPGNRVRLTYLRARRSAQTVSTCEILDVSSDMLMVDPDSKAMSRVIGFDNIVAVHVLVEGERAKALRREMRMYSRAVTTALAGMDLEQVRFTIDALALAYPHDLKVTVEGEE
jgi:proteasome lid subunit RPN8/RPN11